MYFLAKIINKLTGWDISKVQRYVIIGVGVLALIVVLALGLYLKSCWTAHKLKVSQQQIDKINKANEAERKAELKKVIDENTEVIKTVDNRSILTDANVSARDKEIDAKVAEADKKIAEAKQNGHDVTQEELDCILADNCQ